MLILRSPFSYKSLALTNIFQFVLAYIDITSIHVFDINFC